MTTRISLPSNEGSGPKPLVSCVDRDAVFHLPSTCPVPRKPKGGFHRPSLGRQLRLLGEWTVEHLGHEDLQGAEAARKLRGLGCGVGWAEGSRKGKAIKTGEKERERELIFGGSTLQNRVFSYQNRGRSGSR